MHTGYRPNTAQQKAIDLHVGSRSIAKRMGGMVDHPILRRFLPRVMDQGSTSSCTGHAFAAGIAAALGARSERTGEKWDDFVPSPRAIYAEERGLEMVATGLVGDLLEDAGAMPADGIQAIQRFGVVPMGPPCDGRYSDVSERNVNDPATLGDVEFSTLLLGAHPITSEWEALEYDLIVALSNGAPVSLAVPGGAQSWRTARGNRLRASDFGSEPLDHYVLLYDWVRSPEGEIVWTIRNSWGHSWGHGGDTPVATDFLQQYSGDRYALQVRTV